MTDIQVGVQLHLPTYRDKGLPDLLAIADRCVAAGFRQIWVTDNLTSRSNFVVLAALAERLDVDLGLAILGQYFRSPIEAATALVSVGELMPGRELSVAIGMGNPFTRSLIEMPRPIAFMRETVRCLRGLLAGELIAIDDYPILGEYFRFAPGTYWNLPPARCATTLYGGGNGPLGLAMAGHECDGLLFGWTFVPEILSNQLDAKLDIADDAASAAGRRPLRKVAEIKISVAEDHAAARDGVANRHAALRALSLRIRGYSDDQLRLVGIDPATVDEIQAAFAAGVPITEMGHLVTEAMIDATAIAGDPGFCRERLEEFVDIARERGFEQVMLSEVGPDPANAVELLGSHVLPHVFDI
jgi:alkanesulfonate monooxygenase SsuD/methylene tetrahydromethanopterin reductase-like flavin-dependent oxidoreductase (luciferase family)